MLLLMIERGLPIDMVLTADTGMEFPEMYRHWDRIEQYLFQKRGLKLTILRHPKGFEWLMFSITQTGPGDNRLHPAARTDGVENNHYAQKGYR